VLLSQLAITSDRAVRDLLEVAIVVAVGAMLASAITRIRAGRIKPLICPACSRPTARAYPRCKHCGTEL
jgi:hypothetical protein